jgi:hypothetical protein
MSASLKIRRVVLAAGATAAALILTAGSASAEPLMCGWHSAAGVQIESQAMDALLSGDIGTFWSLAEAWVTSDAARAEQCA